MRVFTLLLLLTCGALSVRAQSVASAADSAAIMEAIDHWERAWENHDPALATVDYATDADWTNAFGMRRIGRANIKALVSEVFALPFVMAGRTRYDYHDLRFLNSQIAILRSLALREGQQLPDGSVEETRRTNHLRVFSKRGGRWVIVSHLIGDARTPGQPR